MGDNPVSNIVAEKCLIASMLEDSTIVPKVCEYVRVEDFSDKKCRDIVRIIFQLDTEGKSVTYANIAQGLDYPQEAIAQELIKLHKEYPTAQGWEEHAIIVRDKAIIRRAYEGCLNISQKLLSPKINSESAQKMVNELAQGVIPVNIARSEPLFTENDFDQYSQMSKYPTAWDELNKIHIPTSGNLLIIGADTNIGKTTFALNLALNYALVGYRVLFFSCEMHRSDMSMKAYSYLRIGTQQEIRRAFYSREEHDPYVLNLRKQLKEKRREKQAIIDILSKNIYLRVGNVSLDEFHREIIACDYPKLIFVDYIQEMKVKLGHSRYTEIAELASGLKSEAMNNDCVVFAMTQLTREKDRNGKTIILRSREASDIVNKADVFFELVDEDYDPSSPPVYKPQTRMMLNIRKNRMGIKGSIPMYLYGDYQTFTTRENPLEGV